MLFANEVKLIGYLASKLDVTCVESGELVCTFIVLVQSEDESQRLRVEAREPWAEGLMHDMGTGSSVFVEGRLVERRNARGESIVVVKATRAFRFIPLVTGSQPPDEVLESRFEDVGDPEF